MPRICTICNHPERAEIEAAIVATVGSYRDIARQFSVSKDAIARHKEKCIGTAIQQSQTAKEEAQSLDIVKQLKEINDAAFAILKEAREAKENELALKAMDRIGKQLELQAKLLGEIGGTQVNVILSSEWVNMRTVIVAALAPFPDARIAVAQALKQLE